MAIETLGQPLRSGLICCQKLSLFALGITSCECVYRLDWRAFCRCWAPVAFMHQLNLKLSALHLSKSEQELTQNINICIGLNVQEAARQRAAQLQVAQELGFMGGLIGRMQAAAAQDPAAPTDPVLHDGASCTCADSALHCWTHALH